MPFKTSETRRAWWKHYNATPERKMMHRVRDKKYRDALSPEAKERARLRTREWQVSNKARHKQLLRKGHLKQKYGLTLVEYDAFLVRQNGVCALCYSVDKRALSVDHDHKTGRVRALLCHKCNVLVGCLESRPRNLDIVTRAYKLIDGEL
jgi:hypothetical protein